MNKLQMDPALGGGIAPWLVVKVQRRARPPTPWAIHEEGGAESIRCSMCLYHCAEDAWAVGRFLLSRLPKSAIKALAVAGAVILATARRRSPGASTRPMTFVGS